MLQGCQCMLGLTVHVLPGTGYGGVQSSDWSVHRATCGMDFQSTDSGCWAGRFVMDAEMQQSMFEHQAADHPVRRQYESEGLASDVLGSSDSLIIRIKTLVLPQHTELREMVLAVRDQLQVGELREPYDHVLRCVGWKHNLTGPSSCTPHLSDLTLRSPLRSVRRLGSPRTAAQPEAPSDHPALRVHQCERALLCGHTGARSGLPQGSWGLHPWLQVRACEAWQGAALTARVWQVHCTSTDEDAGEAQWVGVGGAARVRHRPKC